MSPVTPGFWVDWLGFLWYGPLESGVFKRFEGVHPKTLKILWATADINAAMPVDVCTFELAARTVDRYVKDAKARRGK